jgi:hypothetical protein
VPRNEAIAQRALTVLPPLLALLPFLALALPAEAGAQDAAREGAHTLAGTVYDSLAGTPLAGALVQLVARDDAGRVLSARSDASGAFEVSGLSHGRYLVGFMHPVLDSLGIELPPEPLEVSGDSVVHIALAIPSALTIRSELCPDSREKDDSTGLVMGFIRDADSGMPLDNAAVLVSWTELVAKKKDVRLDRRELRVNARSNGWYAICGATSDAPLTAHAERGDAHTGDVEIVVPPRGLVHRDFSIPAPLADAVVSNAPPHSARARQALGTARLSGNVRNAHGKPIGGALLTLRGSGVSASSNEDGSFSLAGLLAGTQTLEVRSVGYAPKNVAVDLFSNQPRAITVTLDERVDVLEDVTVYGKRRQRRELVNFLERRKNGIGHFMTREDIEKQHRIFVTDLFRSFAGIRVTNGLTPEYDTILFSRGITGVCKPALYIDGVLVIEPAHINTILRPYDIAAVEIYKASEAPAPYQTRGCGTILVWMGQGPETEKN